MYPEGAEGTAAPRVETGVAPPFGRDLAPAGGAAPATRLRAVYSGLLHVRRTANYLFWIDASDAGEADVRVDGARVAWHRQSEPRPRRGVVRLDTGFHDLEISYESLGTPRRRPCGRSRFAGRARS